MTRWLAIVYYRHDTGIVPVEYDIEELGEIEDKVEAGPHWETIEKIEIFLKRHLEEPNLTVERALEI